MSLHLRLQLRWTRALVLCAQLHGPRTYCLSEEQALVDAYNAVPDSDESYTPDAATMAAVLKSQNKTSAISDPLSVADQVASYGGVDLDAARRGYDCGEQRGSGQRHLVTTTSAIRFWTKVRADLVALRYQTIM